MILKPYTQIHINGIHADDIRTHFMAAESERYNLTDPFRNEDAKWSVMMQLPYLLPLLGESLSGKVVLDLGCGAKEGLDTRQKMKRILEARWTPTLRDQFNTQFEPWLCRALHYAGTTAIGVDVGASPDEIFRYHQVDLTLPNCLAFLPHASVDLVHMREVLNSPYLSKGLQKNPLEMMRNLMPQLELIVKPDGFFLFNEEEICSVENARSAILP
ncbi:hypothetical protein HZB02_05040 [Candidatus Woesearchaeota archaeon]|nr:hypothetical protein [Candidatus Woesearchaeota archaeon]